MNQTLTRSSGAAECRELVVLAAILDPSVHVAIWRRPADSRITDLLTSADCRVGQHSRFVGRSGELTIARGLNDLLPDAARTAHSDGAEALAADIAGLCEMFTELVSADELLVSLESPKQATCPRFHVDRVGIRMLVTYLGPGTEWLSEEDVDRNWLGNAGHGLVDEASGVIKPDAEVQQVSPFDVVLLKGEAWPGAEGFGAVHRSPNPDGQRRMLLRVDMLSQTALDTENDQ